MSSVDILGPVLGFLGGALAVGLGFLQWRRTERNRRTRELSQRSAAAIEELQSRLRQLQILSRGGAISAEALGEQTRHLNIFLIEKRSVLDAEIETAARDYLAALGDIHREIAEAGTATQDDWANTLARPQTETEALRQAVERMEAAETALTGRLHRAWENMPAA
ncbi:hypothetical protein GCM10009661_44130 [Catellatospora chokoriensis]|uniref:Uncharacterized protein n=1 Tax=Catellatospora chokoriensis TaxID=310353 RepID=A0A8J3NTN2_9ACTN|nr:hypothetical protein Cch02nite_56140 [Catellatospora chokoriensis]